MKPQRPSYPSSREGDKSLPVPGSLTDEASRWDAGTGYQYHVNEARRLRGSAGWKWVPSMPAAGSPGIREV